VPCGSGISLEHAGSYVAAVNSFGCSSGSVERLDVTDVHGGHTTDVVSYFSPANSGPKHPLRSNRWGLRSGSASAAWRSTRAVTSPGRARTSQDRVKPRWSSSTSTTQPARAGSLPHRRSVASRLRATSSHGGPLGQPTRSPAEPGDRHLTGEPPCAASPPCGLGTLPGSPGRRPPAAAGTKAPRRGPRAAGATARRGARRWGCRTGFALPPRRC